MALAVAAAAITACSEQDPLLGTVLTAGDTAPAFELRDQFDQPVSLGDYSEDVVVLTFLYTACPDICPIVANHLRDVHSLLGEEADDVGIVVISIDPARDTVQAAHEYSEKWGMLDNWAYLVGDREQLSSVWKAYFVDPIVGDASHTAVTGAAPTATATRGGVNDFLRETIEQYTISHSAPVYLIDRERVMRVLFTLPLDPEEIVHDIRKLLG